MPSAARGRATVKMDGLVYLFGGESADDNYLEERNEPGAREPSAYNRAVHAYDPKSDTWSGRTGMPIGAYVLTAHLLDEKIYVFNAYSVPNGFNSAVQVYDPKTDHWEQSSPRPTSSYTFVSEAVGGKVYVIGGQGPGGSDPDIWPYRDDVEIFDPKAGWTRGARLPQPVSGAASCSLGDRIFVFGGDVNNLTSVYDVKADRWSTATPPPTARNGHACVRVGDTFFLLGGRDSIGNPLNKVESYEPASDHWECIGELRVGRFWFGTTALDHEIYAFGGAVTGGLLDDVEAFDVSQALR